MVILVTDTGFAAENWANGFVPLTAVSDQPGADMGPLAIDLAEPALTPAEWARLCALLPRAELIRIRLRHFGDMQGFDLARAIRRSGYRRRLRAHGAVLAGHYTLARRAGFSEIQLLPHQAQRQPPEHWQNIDAWAPVRRAPAPPFLPLRGDRHPWRG